jgi:hypothetical protein
MAGNNNGNTVHNSGWRLFRLCQHLGLTGTHLQALKRTDLQAMLTLLDNFTITERSKIWLYAYERNYRDRFFQALHANHNRGRWAKRENRPDSQIIFYMDDREEDFRRHLEEFNPAIETLGAAGFFGVAMNYKGMDGSKSTPRCQVDVSPTHEVHEAPRTGSDKTLARHNRGHKLNQWLANWLHHGLRRNLLTSHFVIDLIAPLTLMGLLAKSLLAKPQHSLLASMAQRISPRIKTQLKFMASGNATAASPEDPKTGFTDIEQADCVAGLLRIQG